MWKNSLMSPDSFSTGYYIVGRLVKDPDKSVAEATFIPNGRSTTRPTASINLETLFLKKIQ